MDKSELTKKMVKELQYRFRDYDDGCGDINCTLLAENMAEEHDLYEDDQEFSIPEWVFDAAVDASDKYKELQGRAA